MALSSAEKESETNAIVSPSGIVQRGLLAVVIAVFANALLRVGSVTLVPALAAVEPFGWGPIVASSVVAAIGATVVYWTLARFTERPNRNFTAVAGAVLALSFVPLATAAPAIPGMTTAGVLALGAMHVVSAVVIVAALTGAVRR